MRFCFSLTNIKSSLVILYNWFNVFVFFIFCLFLPHRGAVLLQTVLLRYQASQWFHLHETMADINHKLTHFPFWQLANEVLFSASKGHQAMQSISFYKPAPRSKENITIYLVKGKLVQELHRHSPFKSQSNLNWIFQSGIYSELQNVWIRDILFGSVLRNFM